MRILILNWRDINNPSSGGAEILTHEIAKRLVVLGNDVVQFSSFFPGAHRKETVDNVEIVREGNADIRSLFSSVHFRAFLFYQREKRKFDVVIDEIHGIPFFTPWYVKEKKVVLICEVASDLWIKVFGLFFGLLGRMIEKFYLFLVYKNILFITISDSTKKDLIENGVNKENVIVLPMGINVPRNIEDIKKEKEKTLIFVGRLTAAKGIEETLSALKEIIRRDKDVRLWIVGKGEANYVQKLKRMCKQLHIEDNVTFYGFVSERKKFTLLARAHLLIHLSHREGFGLTIPEAGCVGTPVVAYNSPGLRDIVKNGKNGILVAENSPKSLANTSIRLLSNDSLYQKLCQGAREEARQYNWDNTVNVMLNSLKNLKNYD